MTVNLTRTTPPASHDAAAIAALIPHRDSMCLLHEVRHHDALSITCTARSHRLPTNPLLENGRLHSVCGVEYAAQAMAVHGALLAGRSRAVPRGGRLAGLRSLELNVTRLDDIDAELEISATLVLGDGNNMIYAFTVHASSQLLLSGRATVVLTPDAAEARHD